ncbi:MAG: hypothetical protein WBX25_02815 [Rhodomicrobium sp.]
MSAALALLEQLKERGLTIKVVGNDKIEIEGSDAALNTAPLDESSAIRARSSKR